MLRKTLSAPGLFDVVKKQDGNSKNDCEQNASKRMLENIRREHPHLKLIVVEDALYATGPHVKTLQQ